MPTQDTADTTTALQRPRSSLEHKLLLWTLVLIIAPTLVCVWWFNQTTRQVMRQHYLQSVGMLGRTVATGLAGSAQSLRETAPQRLRVLAADQRLAFVIITDTMDRQLYREVPDEPAWMSYLTWQDERSRSEKVEITEPMTLGPDDDLVIHRVPIWDPPLTAGPAPCGEDGDSAVARQLRGHVLLALRENSLNQMLAELRTMQFTAACMVCLLCLPMVTWGVRRVTAPIRALVQASLRLASGETPEPVKTHSNDEVGMLAEAFNFMAGRLLTTRRLLEKANSELEHKVAERTAELQRLNEQLERTARQFETMAATDPLTGVANRRAFNESLRRAATEAQRHNAHLSCVMIDLDGFKQFNDRLGHQMGDDLLQITARAMAVNCRGSDVVGRYGGDEFVLLLPRADTDIAHHVSERIRQTFQQELKRLTSAHRPAPKVTMSVGIASYSGDETIDPDQLVANADHALYRAKHTGKDQVMIFTPALRNTPPAPQPATLATA